ncbi:calponin-1 [Exaiptasia diaphana]|uniref:Calponin-homology (CH) domain-containing protein n=1 Tax=Exaiptasia diaphana TaxID=2652724 RepID=A0A913Y6F0_EXADI|nr:calponin-1 [Exaiptasia diaphana]KXJ22199.1 Calponin-1 [Exaiptasia diaphana]
MSHIKRRGSNRHKSYGDMAELERKMERNYDKQAEMQCRDWLEMMTGETLNWGIEHEYSNPWDGFADALDDGVILCRVMNEVEPGAIKKYHSGDKMKDAKRQENIFLFIDACQKSPFNCLPVDMFDPADLYERKNMGKVVNAIQAFVRKAHKYDKTVPLFGPRQHEPNERENHGTQ